MSRELINRITIKKDGVYLSHKSSNDTAPFYSSKYTWLTDIYNREGQKGLDKEIIKILQEGNELRGNHKSIIPYKKIMQDYYTLENYPLRTKIYNFKTLFLSTDYNEEKVGMPKEMLGKKIDRLEEELCTQLANDVEKYRKEENQEEKQEIDDSAMEETDEMEF